MLRICLLLLPFYHCLRVSEEASVRANPIRKVVTMLQNMQKKVEAEGDKEKELFEKFQCYCNNGEGDLKASIQAAEAKGPALTSAIEEAESKKVQLDEDLKSHRTDRTEAKAAITSATKLREKQADAFASTKAESEANLNSIQKALTALNKGAAAGFLQTRDATVLRRLTASRDMTDDDRHEVLAFLSGGSDESYAATGGEIVGILKQLSDELSASLAEATTAEHDAIANYDSLMAAKKKEVESLTASIETKTQRVGELAVEVAQMKNDLDKTTEGVLEDKKFLANLDKTCESKMKEFEERTKTRGEELLALADTIKILNDDDALELFKKTLPSASSSFVQLSDGIAARARAAIKGLRVHGKNRPQFDFIALALNGNKIGFGQVIKMIDDMVGTLKQEQTDDNDKREYCNTQMDQLDDKKKGLERKISDVETAIEDAKETIATLNDEIKALSAGIKALDKSVADATEQRQEESAEFKSTMASNSAAKEILGFAKNRLNKFYNPALYKEPKKETVLVQNRANPGPPPETPSGPYQKKSEESNGVIAMIDLLVKDLEKDMTEAKVEEQNAQADYEQGMKDSADKRKQDKEALTEKKAASADLEAMLEEHDDAKKSAKAELTATHEVIKSLHNECDFIIKYYDARKEAREGEISALESAKAVLSGADYS